jgi:hypothetical protein
MEQVSSRVSPVPKIRPLVHGRNRAVCVLSLQSKRTEILKGFSVCSSRSILAECWAARVETAKGELLRLPVITIPCVNTGQYTAVEGYFVTEAHHE